MHFTRKELNRWLDEGLSPKRLRHVESCAACAVEARRFRTMVHALEQLPPLAPAEGFADRVMARFEPATPRAAVRPVAGTGRRNRVWAAVAGLGGICLGTTVGVGSWILTHPNEPARALGVVGSLAADLVQQIAHQSDAIFASSTVSLIRDTVTEHAGSIIAGAAVFMSLYIIGCALMVRLLRPPRRSYATVHSS